MRYLSLTGDVRLSGRSDTIAGVSLRLLGLMRCRTVTSCRHEELDVLGGGTCGPRVGPARARARRPATPLRSGKQVRGAGGPTARRPGAQAPGKLLPSPSTGHRSSPRRPRRRPPPASAGPARSGGGRQQTAAVHQQCGQRGGDGDVAVLGRWKVGIQRDGALQPRPTARGRQVGRYARGLVEPCRASIIRRPMPRALKSGCPLSEVRRDVRSRPGRAGSGRRVRARRSSSPCQARAATASVAPRVSGREGAARRAT
jgi:hypothetical protein